MVLSLYRLSQDTISTSSTVFPERQAVVRVVERKAISDGTALVHALNRSAAESLCVDINAPFLQQVFFRLKKPLWNVSQISRQVIISSQIIEQ